MAKKKVEIASLCFWCGSENGKVKHELEDKDPAPTRAVVSYDPCKTCKDRFATGVAIFETNKKPYYEKQPPLFAEDEDGVFPSGRWAILPVEIVSTVFNDDAAAEFKKSRQGYVDEESFRLIQGSGEQPTQH